MKIDINELFDKYSYIISILDNEIYQNRLNIVQKLFNYHKLTFPKIFIGTTNDDKKQFGNLCTKSHWLILDMAKKLNLPYILVFEDDVYPCNNVLKYLSNVLDDIPDNIDILQLGFINNTNKLPNFINKNNVEFIKITKSVPFKQYMPFFDNGHCTGFQAVIYFNNSFEKIQKTLIDTKLSVDYIQKYFKSYVLKYPLFLQYDPIKSQRCRNGDPYARLSKDKDVVQFYKNFPKIEQILQTK